MSTLREFIEEASRRIEREFDERGAVYPMYHFTTVAGDVVMPAPHPDKDTALAMMRLLFESLDTDRYAFMDEMWIVEGSIDKIAPGETHDVTLTRMQELLHTLPRPSQHPDRREVVTILAEDQTEGLIHAHREIVRDANGKGKLGPLVILPHTVSLGRMVGLLPQKGTKQ